MSNINRGIIIVLDGFGVGELPDANEYNDIGSNTLEGIYNNVELKLPNLKKMGLYNIDGLNINEKEENVIGAFGKMKEKACRKKQSGWALGNIRIRAKSSI